MADTFIFELPSGETVIADASDRDLIESRGPWHARPGPQTTYAQASNGRGGTILLHRLLMAATDGSEVDHANRNGLDNRRRNLRICGRGQNAVNTPPRPGRTSRFKGVHWDREGSKWRAEGFVGRKKAFTRRFDSELDAAAAYDDFAYKQWGEFAWLNRDHFPELVAS